MLKLLTAHKKGTAQRNDAKNFLEKTSVPNNVVWWISYCKLYRNIGAAEAFQSWKDEVADILLVKLRRMFCTLLRSSPGLAHRETWTEAFDLRQKPTRRRWRISSRR